MVIGADDYLGSTKPTCMSIRYASAFAALMLPFALAAQGDTCTNALPILAGFHHADGPITGDGAIGYGCAGWGQDGDWYVYVPSFTGTINITSCVGMNEPTDDTYLMILTGSCGSLSCIGYNDDMGSNSCPGHPFATYLDVAVTAGQTYYIVWSSVFDGDDFYWQLGECYATVSGTTYRDDNANGVRDEGEAHVDAVLARNPGGTFHYSGTDTYSFCSDSGNFDLTIPNPPLYHTVSPSSQSYTASTLGSLVTDMNFGFNPQPGHYDGQCDIWGWAPWIGNNTNYQINYGNVGTEDIDGSVVLTLHPLTSFVSANPAPSNIAGQTITWAVGTLSPGDHGQFSVTYHTDSTALTTDVVTAMVVFDINQTDETPEDNNDEVTDNPTTSFDPNDKAVDVQWVSQEEIANGKALEYTIRFQNTGEMPAVNIVLRDEIDADLDLSTFEYIGATHENQIAINGRELIFTFPQIMLPDSASDPEGSTGAVHFRIRPVASSDPGTLFENTAGIYFDYNEPVITNTVITEVSAPISVQEIARTQGFVVYPNPGSGDERLLWGSATVTDASIEVLDVTGRILLRKTAQVLVEGQSSTLDLSTLSDGHYLVRVQHGSIYISARISIEH